jgi:hypothetical protein
LDFLVAGLGFGALLIIVGYAVREIGVFLFAPIRVRKQFPENPTLADAWRRMIRAASNASMVAGGAMWLLALLAVALDLSDGSGAIAMASAATIVSLAGAGVIALAWRQMDASAPEQAETQPTTKIATQPQPPAVVEEEEAFDEWRPRVIGRASSTIAGDMPAWGATYIVDEEPAAEPPAPAEAQPAVETEASDDSDAAAEPPTAPEPEPVVVSAGNEPQVEADDADAAADAVAVEVDSEPEPVVAERAPADEEAPTPEPVPTEAHVEQAVVPDATPEPVIGGPVAEPETEPKAAAPVDDLVISEQPAPEPRATDDQGPSGPRRFKSSLLADIDENGPAETNAAFKSALLADLSSVRLPDDVPRFHPTTLIDSPAAEEADDKAKPNGSSSRR